MDYLISISKEKSNYNLRGIMTRVGNKNRGEFHITARCK